MLVRSSHFCRNYILAFLATSAAMFGMSTLDGLHTSYAVLVILPPIASAMIEGQAFVRKRECRPDNRLCWKASLRMSALVVLMWVSLIIPVLVFNPQKLVALAEIDATGRAAVYLLLCFVTCCALRTGYAIGLATELKGQQFPDR